MAKNMNVLENLALISQIGISMIMPIVASLYIGNLVDNKLDTGPIFLFIFIILGVVSAFISVYKLTQRQFQKEKRK